MKKIPWKSITQGSGLAELNRRQQVPWSAYADPPPGASFYLQPLYFFFFCPKVLAHRDDPNTGQVIAKPFDVLGRSWGQPWRKGSTRLNHGDWKPGFNTLPRLFLRFYPHFIRDERNVITFHFDRGCRLLYLWLIKGKDLEEVNNLAKLIFHRLNCWYRFGSKRKGME